MVEAVKLSSHFQVGLLAKELDQLRVARDCAENGRLTLSAAWGGDSVVFKDIIPVDQLRKALTSLIDFRIGEVKLNIKAYGVEIDE